MTVCGTRVCYFMGGEGHEAVVVEFGSLDYWTQCSCNWSYRSYSVHHVIKQAQGHAKATTVQAAEAQRLTHAQTQTDGAADHPSSTPPPGGGRGSAQPRGDASVG